MVLAGDRRRRSAWRLTADRMPVGALPVIVCRLGVILSVRGPFSTVTCAVRVNMCERCRTAP